MTGWRSFTRIIVLGGIDAAAGDPAEMKRRIMLAVQCGFLENWEAEDWIMAARLIHA